MIKKVLKNKYLPFIILFVIMILIHSFFIYFPNAEEYLGEYVGVDDNYFKSIEAGRLADFVKNRYNTWSSRILIEIVLVIIVKLPKIIWILLNSFFITLIAYSISKIFTENNTYTNYIITVLILLYPFNHIASAGWCATTINYIWPLSLGLFSLIPIKNSLINKKEKTIMYPIYSVSLLFACNQEQMCAIVVAFYFIFSIYLYLKNNKKDTFIIIQTILAICSIIFILTCPGNDIRALEEIKNLYPQYEYLNFCDKIVLGTMSTFSEFIQIDNLIILLLLILLPISAWKKKNSKIIKTISLIPLIILSGIYISSYINTGYIANLYSRLTSYRYFKLTLYNNLIILDKELIILISVILLFVVSIIAVLLKVLNKGSNYLTVLIFLAGICSRIMMGFSASIYASYKRTFIFLYFACIIINIILIRNLKKPKKEPILLKKALNEIEL